MATKTSTKRDTALLPELDMALLCEVLVIPTESFNTGLMRRFLLKWLRTNGVDHVEDDAGNIYATKPDGSDRPYPTLVSHVDTVHAIDTELDVYWMEAPPKSKWDVTPVVGDDPRWAQPYVTGLNRRTLKPSGIGGDDKCGIHICLQALKFLPRCKVVFVVDEEVGCIGSRQADMKFFLDSSFVLQADRRGHSDITDCIMGAEMNSNEWGDAIGDLLALHERQWVAGGMTDVWQLKENGLAVCAANFSCGYYNPHMDNEYICLKHLEDTMHLMLAICVEHGHVRWPHVARDSNPTADETEWNDWLGEKKKYGWYKDGDKSLDTNTEIDIEDTAHSFISSGACDVMNYTEYLDHLEYEGFKPKSDDNRVYCCPLCGSEETERDGTLDDYYCWECDSSFN